MKPGKNVKRVAFIPQGGPPQPRRLIVMPRSKPYPYASQRQNERNMLKLGDAHEREWAAE